MEDDKVNRTQEIFTRIYDTFYWGSEGCGSGPGSALNKTEGTRQLMTFLFKKYEWKSIMDAPCGAMEWQLDWLENTPDLPNLKFVGVDIVTTVISGNVKKIPLECRHELEFYVCDIANGKLPIESVDVILCRDALQHLPLEYVNSVLVNISNSNAKFALIGSYPTRNGPNKDVQVGGYFPIDLARHPFNLPDPIGIFDEKNADKHLYLFDVEDLKKKFIENNGRFIVE